MVQEVDKRTLGCERNGCTITFSSPGNYIGESDTAMVAAIHHEAQPHIGIARVEGTDLFRAVNLTFDGPKFLTGPIPQSSARSVVAQSVGDMAPEYFLNNSDGNGQKG